MWIVIGFVIGFIASVFGFLLGWGMAVKFKSFYNFANYLQGKPEWSTKVQDGRTDVPVYSGSINQAKAIARIHGSIIIGHK